MITAVCAMVLGLLLGGSDLADRRRTRQSERARIAEIAAGLDRFQWWVLEDLAETRQAFLHRDRRNGDEEVQAFAAALERATKVGIPDEPAVYRLADQLIRNRADIPSGR